MAVVPKAPQLVKDFWPRFKRGALFIIITLQLLILLALALVLHSFGFFQNNPIGVAGALVANAILGIVASVIIYHIIARPIKYLLAALVHIAGEHTNTTPPNPNEEHFQKNGLSPVLRTIYQLAADTPDPIAESSTDKKPAAPGSIEAALDATACGFVAMKADRSIAYANVSTPLKIDASGVQSLELLFDEHNNLYTWWDECTESAVHAEKTWSRIPSKLPDDENRRFFDVIASYNKESEYEMVLTLVDRTKIYEVGEEELEFIAFAAHELRGPITVIRGYLDVLQGELETVLQPEQVELFRRLTVSANRLSGYINNILNTSRYDRRHLSMHLAETTVKSVYDTIRDDMDLRASAQNRLLSVSIPEDLPTIAADTASLGEVFGNIIDNAIKYSNEGGSIVVVASSKGDSVEFAVEDHGIGMPGNVVSSLFQKFYRSHRSRETVAGTGIGLYISKAIVESHGGSISVRSEDGHGSTFIISLPTYKMVAEKLKASNNGNETLISSQGSWIKNHTMYRG